MSVDNRASDSLPNPAQVHHHIRDDNTQVFGNGATTQPHAESPQQSTSPKPTNSVAEAALRTEDWVHGTSNATSGQSTTSPDAYDLLRYLSLVAETSPQDGRPGSKFPELGLSGNVISVNFRLPYKVKLPVDARWDIEPRKGTSALFDSFSYLASSESEWNHTLVGWTGEIELPHSNEVKPSSKRTAPIPVNPQLKPLDVQDPSEFTVRRQDRMSLAWQLSVEHGSRVYPIWLPDDIAKDGTDTYRKQEKWRCYGDQHLFPLFHYKQMEPSDGRATKEAYKDYEKFNHAFAEAIMNVYRPGDIVMIHDYHLLLLPQILRRMLPNIFVGLFLHIPFPSSEYFRALSTRRQLLHGMLGADMIGFQTQSYAAHFRQSCATILGLAASREGVDFHGDHTAFETFPIGINASATLQRAFDPAVDKTIARLIDEKTYNGRKVIVGRDRLDSTRGVSQKLNAFELFLERNPEWINEVILVQVMSEESVDKRDEKSDRIERLVSRINGNLGHLGYAPIHYYSQYLPQDEYFALLRIADVGLITSVRDGMNTTALEYVVCQRDKKSPLVISEFSGTADNLHQAVNINPWDLAGTANSILEALQMSRANKVASHCGLYKTVTENSVQRWTTKCINRLIANLVASNRYQRTPALNQDDLLNRYALSTRRLFMFDYDGTLTPIVTDPAAAIPSENTLHTLETLASHPGNAVWIISGRDQTFLAQHMGHIPSLGLSAEHGSFMRRPHSTQWDSLTEHMDISWQDSVTEIFNRYSESARGSYVEQKKIAVTWHYRKAEDAVLAHQEAQKCQTELNRTVAKKFDVDVMAGKANVEVRPHFVNKGEIVNRLLQTYEEGEGGAPDFVLCLGDDSTDEDMFQKLRCSRLPDDQVFAVTVGASSKPTLASSYLSEPEDVISVIALLNSLSNGAGSDTEPDSEGGSSVRS